MFLLPLAGQCWAAEWCFPVLCGAQRSHAETFSANICLRCFPGWRSTDLTYLLKVDHPSSALTLPENSSPSTSQVSFPAGILHVFPMSQSVPGEHESFRCSPFLTTLPQLWRTVLLWLHLQQQVKPQSYIAYWQELIPATSFWMVSQ